MKKVSSVLLASVGSLVLAGSLFTTGADGHEAASSAGRSEASSVTKAVETTIPASAPKAPSPQAPAAPAGTLPVGPSGKSVVQNPTTYTNPISLTQGSERILTAGEPVIKIFDGDYYLFTRGRKGYWWSSDFKDWNYVDAPNLLGGIVGMTEIDGKLYNYAGNTNNRVMTTDDPKTGIWYDAGTFSSNNYGDASMLYDEDTGRLFMYYGWSQILGIRVVELDKHTFKEISKPQVVLWGDPHNHGWETRYSEDLIFPYFTDREYRPQEYGWTEGPHPLKYKGKYYVLYSSIGLEFASYAQGVYVADDPMGPYKYDEHNPLTRMVSGSAPGAGHGSFFQDKQGKLWTIAMVAFTQNGGAGNTLMSLFPTDVDKQGVMHGDVEYGDYPQYLPGVKKNPIKDNFTGWTLLSLNKKVETSSTQVNYWPALAVDENGKSFWSAQTGDPGEYLTVDLGKESDIRGIQTQWDKAGARGTGAIPRYESYTVQVSSDNQNWTTVIDKSNNPQDLQSDYVELPTAVTGRYVRLTNVFTPDSGKFAVKEFRVFGNPGASTFTKVPKGQVMAVRNQVDRRRADLLWQPVEGAEGYVVRYGIEPNKLYQSEMVYGKNSLAIKSLNVDPEYYFQVEAFSSGTPRYVENPFETRGRGAELDFTRQPTGGARTTEKVMTYETYGRDEKYVFDNVTPGTYTLKHTYGVGIWGPQELTADQLIGTGTKPTYTALNLTQFGNGSTQWGTIEVRVYPGATSGRVEVTFHYTDDTSGPTVTVKNGPGETSGNATDGYQQVSYKLFDKSKVDKVVINGVTKDLTDNQYSDVNFIKPGVFGAQLGDNTMDVYDAIGQVTTLHFTLVP
ncbi:family 43 glycosylhydrolase [Nocardioides anomalus]|uniref:Family 43 glycosylhydrolase n=1 Tax=Nocardioides anomalus TaxID=2712223 RepID=A0A6G6WB73_9ACTN|nr:discoidin domain-containing protein [Nocardioides anomalus]QIG42407.1 family 43 glycosylhydrolase [Nocardioides anomalus]